MTCDPHEAALKSFFLGPQAENSEMLKGLFMLLADEYIQWRQTQYPEDGTAVSVADKMSPEFQLCVNRFQNELKGLLKRYESEVPKFSPRYIGHMFSEVSLPALMGHFVSLLHNPNNISSDVSRVGSQIEGEAITLLHQMVGYEIPSAQGHFTSGGTLANFEALVRARDRMKKWLGFMSDSRMRRRHDFNLFESAHCGWKLFDRLSCDAASETTAPVVDLEKIYGFSYLGPVVLVPHSKHYSWVKGVSLLGLPKESLWQVELDFRGRMDVSHLQTLIERAKRENRPILMVVSIAGTTELGEIDPIHRVVELIEQYWSREGIEIWHHVDAAYGGFFRLSLNHLEPECQSALKALANSDSITIDPHKLGYVPYSCGAFLCKDERNYVGDPIDAPYVFQKSQRATGYFTIEGSRSSAGATAMWLTARTVGLNDDGYGRIIGRTILARKALSKRLSNNKNLQLVENSDTNILCFMVADNNDKLSEANRKTRMLWEALSNPDQKEIFVSKTVLSSHAHGNFIQHFVSQWNGINDQQEIFMIRLCLMNPFLQTKETRTQFIDLIDQTLKTHLSLIKR